MKDLDKKILDALQKEDAEWYKDFADEPSMFEMVMDTFRGRHRWLVFLTMFWTFAFFVFSVFSAVQFFAAEETRDLLLWALAFILGITAVSLLKTWYWMELNKNAVTREIKRLELQIAHLAGRIKA